MPKLKTDDALKRYVGCIDKRLENKRKKGTPEYSKSADKGLKLVLNSLSGKFGQRGAKAYAPEHRLAMCIIGQMLKNRIVHILRIDQRIETDGVFYTRQLTFADPVTDQVNILILDPTLLEPSFGFFGVKRFVLSPDLNVHFTPQ